MPSFRKDKIIIHWPRLEDIDEFQVEAIPLGFRGIPGLRWLLHLTPYITGSKPRFRVQVRRFASSTNAPFQVAMRRLSADHDYLLFKTTPLTKGFYSENFEDEPISKSAEFTYLLQINGHLPEVKLVSFRAKYQEDITMWVFGFVAALFASGIGASITWLFTK